MYDVIKSSHLHILPIFQTYISPELMQIFANCMIHSKKSRGKNLIIVPLQHIILCSDKACHFEGCPVHPTRVDSSLVLAIRLFARDFENIAYLGFEGELKMLFIRADSIEST